MTENHAFISYAGPDRDLVLNLKTLLSDYGISAWVYERDKTLGDDAWVEIEDQLRASRVVFLLISEHSGEALGQQREFAMCLDRVRREKTTDFIVPLLRDGCRFADLPEQLRAISGEQIDCYNIRTVSQDIAHRFFPSVVGEKYEHGYVCPHPGQWLEIAKVDAHIEDKHSVGDLVYFRQLSPLGLFECYCLWVPEMMAAEFRKVWRVTEAA